MVQPVDQFNQIVALVCYSVVKGVGRKMQKFVGKAIAE
jgi:hypothetical protein